MKFVFENEGIVSVIGEIWLESIEIVVGKSGNMVSERLNSIGKQEISIGNVGNRIRKVVDLVRKTLYPSFETGNLCSETDVIAS